jgi:hypothetical protein
MARSQTSKHCIVRSAEIDFNMDRAINLVKLMKRLMPRGIMVVAVVNNVARIFANVGALAIEFQDTANATLTLPGGRQISITRFKF